MNYKRGLTLVEVLVLIAISSIIVMAVAELFNYQSKLKMRAMPKDVLTDLMTNNLVEVSARPVGALPPINKCRVRAYDRGGTFISESEPDISSALCTSEFPVSTDQYKVTIVAKMPNAVDIEFVPSQFLKLPVHSPVQIMAVEITGGFKGRSDRNEFPYKLFVTTFKR